MGIFPGSPAHRDTPYAQLRVGLGSCIYSHEVSACDPKGIAPPAKHGTNQHGGAVDNHLRVTDRSLCWAGASTQGRRSRGAGRNLAMLVKGPAGVAAASSGERHGSTRIAPPR